MENNHIPENPAEEDLTAELPLEPEAPEVPQEPEASDTKVLPEIPDISDDVLAQDFLAEEDPEISEEIAGFVENNFFSEAPSLEEEPAAPQPTDEQLLTDEELLSDEELLGTEFSAPGDLPAEDPALPEAPIPQEDAEAVFTTTVEEAFSDDYAENQIMEDKDDPDRNPRPARKGRPKRRKGYGLLGIPHLIATCIWLAIIVGIGLSLGRLVWVCAADVLAFGREDKEVTITITADDTIDTITDKLKNAGLIRYADLFKLYADLSSAEEDIVTGTFTLNTNYDYHALVNEMSSNASNREEITVQIPEGYTCRQIFQLLEEKGVCSVADLESYAATGELEEYWFLEDVERGDKYCLEGYLFPDTYNFFTGSSAKAALEKMLNGFDNRFTEDMQAQLTTLNEQLAEKMRKNGETEEYIAEHLFTLRDVVTVASLVEKEAADPTESPTVASVIYNRLFSWGSTPRYLNIDASIVYALDGKTDLTAEDLQVDSPYNTYTHMGLTPGPIANPGVSSLQAALSPADTSYYYYILDPAAGQHIFTKTYEEHEKYRAEIEARTTDE